MVGGIWNLEFRLSTLFQLAARSGIIQDVYVYYIIYIYIYIYISTNSYINYVSTNYINRDVMMSCCWELGWEVVHVDVDQRAVLVLL